MIAWNQLGEASANVFCTPDYYVIIIYALSFNEDVSQCSLTSHDCNNESCYAMFDHKECLCCLDLRYVLFPLPWFSKIYSFP